MNFKKLLVALGAFILGIFLLGEVSAHAASKQLVLKLRSGQNPYKAQWIDVTSSVLTKDISKVEYVSGKVKKASSKKWKNAIPVATFSLDDEAFEGCIEAYENGTYSVRLITKSGEKYVKTVKVKTKFPASENSNKEAVIKKISGPDKKGSYTITVDYLYPYNKKYDEINGIKVGDKLDFFGKEATVTRLYTIDEDDEFVPITVFDDSCYAVICKPENYKDFYPNAEYGDDPETYSFGLLNEGGSFVAYDDYEYGSDAYVTVNFVYKADVKLKAGKNTKVQPAYYDRSRYSDSCEISMKEYVDLKGDDSLKEEYGIYTYGEMTYYIFEKYDKKAKKHTDVVDILQEIYYP